MVHDMEDEAALVERARQEPQAFASLYDRYVDRIYAYAQRETGDQILAQDMVSATFEKALKNLNRYEWRGTSFGAWLYRIARNEIMMVRRKQKWTLPLLGEWTSPTRVEEEVQARQERDHIVAALDRLKQRDQEILRLRYHEELTHEEIGEVLRCSTKNVAVRLHRALKRLRREMVRLDREVQFDVTSG